MLKEKILELRNQIEERAEEVNVAIDEATKAAESDELDKAKELKEMITTKKQELKELEDKLAELEELQGFKKEETRSNELPKGEKNMTVLNNNELNVRTCVDAFIRTRGEKRDGLTTAGAEVVIPEEIIMPVQNEVKTIVDLSTMANKMKVSTGSGKYPVLKGATAKLTSVEELAQNPELAKPEFDNVAWEVKTYRGQMPISQEAIDDSAIDLTALVARNIQEQKINTSNAAIATVLKGFETVAAKDTDGIKEVLNVKLDPGYNRVIVASQSFLQAVDTLKDKNGQYILQSQISEASKHTLFGVPVVVIADNVFGKAGDKVAFIGDVKKAVLMADRVDVTAKWIDNEVYGQILSVATRFDVKAADKSAGFFVTLADTATKPEPETKSLTKAEEEKAKKEQAAKEKAEKDENK